ncbi:MAG: hypothetical protein ABFD44_01350 [Anaerolineaceae bacterium]
MQRLRWGFIDPITTRLALSCAGEFFPCPLTWILLPCRAHPLTRLWAPPAASLIAGSLFHRIVSPDLV